jgi:hypothetical protein
MIMKVKRADAKNKCGSGQPPKPHCYRGRSDCCLSPEAKDHRATAFHALSSTGMPRINDNLKLALQG